MKENIFAIPLSPLCYIVLERLMASQVCMQQSEKTDFQSKFHLKNIVPVCDLYLRPIVI